jgi:CRP-like cAMP-binding protein
VDQRHGEDWPIPGSFLATIDGEGRDALLGAGTPRVWPAHSTLFHQGDPSTHLVVIRSGWVKVAVASSAGYEAILAIRGPGDLIGELSALDDGHRSATVVTLGRAHGSVIPAAQFIELLRVRPRLALALLGYLAARLRDADRRRLEFGSLGVTERLARRLLALAMLHGTADTDRVVIDIPLSQRDLAGAVSASREAVARVLRILRERQVITTHRRRIVILLPEVLRSIGDDPPTVG